MEMNCQVRKSEGLGNECVIYDLDGKYSWWNRFQHPLFDLHLRFHILHSICSYREERHSEPRSPSAQEYDPPRQQPRRPGLHAPCGSQQQAARHTRSPRKHIEYCTEVKNNYTLLISLSLYVRCIYVCQVDSVICYSCVMCVASDVMTMFDEGGCVCVDVVSVY